MDNYIVRVYRQDRNNPRKLVGIVEEVGVKGKKAFTNLDELWEILNAPKIYGLKAVQYAKTKRGKSR
jgi:hypothetical protein